MKSGGGVGGGVGGVEVEKVVVLVSNRPRVKSPSRQIVMYPWAFGANEHFGHMGVWDKWASGDWDKWAFGKTGIWGQMGFVGSMSFEQVGIGGK